MQQVRRAGRRYSRLIAAGVAWALALTLAGCGEEREAASLKLIAVEYRDQSGNSSQRYWDRLVREFELDNPGISVDVDVYPWNEVDKKIADLVKAGKAPDMAQAGAFASYAAQGKLYTADELLSVPIQAAFVPVLADAGQVQRTQYGMPFVASTRVLFYNKDLLEKAGIPNPPKTWTQLAKDAQALKAAGVKVPYALPLGPEEPHAEALNWMLSGGGGYTYIGRYTIDSVENVRTFEWLRDELVGKGLTNPDPASFNRKDAFDAFTRGDVAMLNGHPTLIQLSRKFGIDFGMAPLPGKGGQSKATTGVVDWMMAFKQNGHREQVGKFLDFVYSDKNVLKYADQYGLLPVTVATSEAMRANESKQAIWEFLDQLPTAQSFPVGKPSWGPMVTKLQSTIGTAVSKDGDPGRVLGTLQREAKAIEESAQETS